MITIIGHQVHPCIQMWNQRLLMYWVYIILLNDVTLAKLIVQANHGTSFVLKHYYIF